MSGVQMWVTFWAGFFFGCGLVVAIMFTSLLKDFAEWLQKRDDK